MIRPGILAKYKRPIFIKPILTIIIIDHGGLLAVLVEILSAVLSGGAVTDDVSLTPKGGNGSSQTAIVIDIEHFMPMRRFKSRTKRMVDHLKSHPPLDPKHPVVLPGERSHKAGLTSRKEGVKLSKETIDALNRWLRKLGIRC